MIEGRVSVGGNIFICILFFSLPFSFLSKESVESGRDKDWLVVCVCILSGRTEHLYWLFNGVGTSFKDGYSRL